MPTLNLFEYLADLKAGRVTEPPKTEVEIAYEARCAAQARTSIDFKTRTLFLDGRKVRTYTTERALTKARLVLWMDIEAGRR